MTDAVAIAAIGAIGTVTTLFIKRYFDRLDKKIGVIHEQINGKMTELIEVNRSESKAEGKKEQKDEQDKIDKTKGIQ